MEKGKKTLTIKTEKHANLTASAADRLSEDELNVKDDVEFTVMTVSTNQQAHTLSFVFYCIQNFKMHKHVLFSGE